MPQDHVGQLSRTHHQLRLQTNQCAILVQHACLPHMLHYIHTACVRCCGSTSQSAQQLTLLPMVSSQLCLGNSREQNKGAECTLPVAAPKRARAASTTRCTRCATDHNKPRTTTINRVLNQPIPPNNCPQQPQAPDHSTGRSKTKAGRSGCTSDMCDSKAHPRQAMNRYRLALLDRTPACLQTSASPVQQTQHCATDLHSVFGAARPAASRGQIPWRTCFEQRASTTHAGRLPESW
jgi:hypothetical protein